MQFCEGQVIVHPHHGPATITEITSRQFKGAWARYLVLEVHRSNLVISVPVNSSDVIGLRNVADASELSSLLDVLRAPTGHEESTWSRRFKENRERLSTGDLLITAEVVRDLTRRLASKGLSMGEKEMLRDARKPLIIEIGLSLGIGDEKAEQALDSVLAGERQTTADALAAAS